MHSQFRPAEARRKVRYEDLQVQVPAQAYRATSVMGLPMMHTPPLPTYGGQYWRSW